MGYREVQVLLPEDRVEEFFNWYAGWLSDAAPAQPVNDPPARDPAEETRPWRDDDLADAITYYRALGGHGRRIQDFLIDHPGREFSAEEIAGELDVPNGPSGVAGALGHPVRKARDTGHPLPITYDNGVYYLDRPIAALLDEARELVNEFEDGERFGARCLSSRADELEVIAHFDAFPEAEVRRRWERFWSLYQKWDDVTGDRDVATEKAMEQL